MVKTNGAAAGPRKIGRTHSTRAKLLFPVRRMWNRLRQDGFALRRSDTAGVTMAAALQTIVHDVLDFACDAADAAKRKQIRPREVRAGIQSNADLRAFMRGVRVCGGGVTPTPLARSEVDPKKVKRARKLAYDRKRAARAAAAEEDDE